MNERARSKNTIQRLVGLVGRHTLFPSPSWVSNMADEGKEEKQPWWSNLGMHVMQRLDDLADSLVTQANAAQAQIAAEQTKLKEEELVRKELLAKEKPLPWETGAEEWTIFENDTMERILQLSLREENFTVPPKYLNYVTFNFTEFVPVALRLLHLDANLARMHARLASKMKEETFWHFYYYRITYLRASIGIDGPTVRDSLLGQLAEDDVIVFHATREYDSNDTEKSVVRRKKPAASLAFESAATVAAAKLLAENSGMGKAGKLEGEYDTQDIAQINRRKAEAELAAEVQAELEDDDDLVDFDPDDDLGELAIEGEVNCDDDDDAELEAQIARELDK